MGNLPPTTDREGDTLELSFESPKGDFCGEITMEENPNIWEVIDFLKKVYFSK